MSVPPPAAIVHPAAGTRGEETAFLGMVILLGSWVMLLAALFFAYGVLRLRAPGWPPAGSPPLPRLLPAVASGVLGLSAGALHRALSAARRGERSRTTGGLLAGLVLGCAFLVLQIALWRAVLASGLTLEAGSLAAAFYGLTGLHALYVAVGLLGVGFLLMKGHPERLRRWVLVWDVGVVAWAFLVVLLFVL